MFDAREGERACERASNRWKAGWWGRGRVLASLISGLMFFSRLPVSACLPVCLCACVRACQVALSAVTDWMGKELSQMSSQLTTLSFAVAVVAVRGDVMSRYHTMYITPSHTHTPLVFSLHPPSPLPSLRLPPVLSHLLNMTPIPFSRSPSLSLPKNVFLAQKNPFIYNYNPNVLVTMAYNHLSFLIESW